MTLSPLVLLSLFVCIGAAISTAVGFGATLVILALGSLVMPTTSVLYRLMPLSVLLSAFVLVRDPRHVDLRMLLSRVLPAMALGMPFGLFAVGALPPRDLERAFAGFVFTLAFVELIAMRRGGSGDGPARPLGLMASLTLLFLGGVAHGALATGGPPVVYVCARSLPDKRSFRATLAALWVALNFTLLVIYALKGQVSRETLPDSARLAPALAVGIAVGEVLHGRVSERAFRVGVFVALLVISIALGIKA